MAGVVGMKRGSRLGLKQLKGKIQLKGLAAIDRRTGAARELLRWRSELVAALGGAEIASPQKLALVEQATRAKAIIDHVDAYLLEQESLINKRSRRIMPIVLERTRLSEHFAKLLSQLGLERAAKPVQTLEALLASKGRMIEKVQPMEEENEEVEEPDGHDDPGSDERS